MIAVLSRAEMRASVAEHSRVKPIDEGVWAEFAKRIRYERVEPDRDAKDQRPKWRTYYVERFARLTGTAIANAEGTTDPHTNQPLVLLDFNRQGGRVFGELTTQIVGKKLATSTSAWCTSAAIRSASPHT